MPDTADLDDDPIESTPFLLTRAGSALTVLAVMLLYVSIMFAPACGAVFDRAGQDCAGQGALICTSVGQRIAGMAPNVSCTVGMLVALVGGFLPPLRHRRGLWLALGYGLAVTGPALGFAISLTAP